MLIFQELSTTAHMVFALSSIIWFLSLLAIMTAFRGLLQNPSRTNQIIMLMNLNISELVFCFTIPLRLIPSFTAQCKACEYIRKVENCNGFFYYSSFFFITIDRLLCLILSIKYNLKVTPKRVKIVSVILAFCCFLCSLPFYFLSTETTQSIINSIIYPVLDFLFVVTATTVYTLIIIKLHSRQQRTFDWAAFRRRYRVPFFIVLSFIICIQIPDLYIIISVYLSNESIGEDALIKTLLIYSCWFIGFGIDSVIYIRFVCRRRRRTTVF
eukprot:TCONS_00070589-protein